MASTCCCAPTPAPPSTPTSRWRAPGTCTAPGKRWRGPDFQVRAVLRTEPWVAVGFRLAICELLPTASEQEVVGHLGPDVLGPDWDPAEALRRLRADPDRAIGTALLDQRAIAGPGNVYKSEVCSSAASTPGPRSARSRTWRPWSTCSSA